MSGHQGIIHDENIPPPPPPAPPLPPQRYGNRAASALARFAQPFIYASRPPSAHGDRPTGTNTSGVKSITQRSSSPASRTTTHRTGLPINALDISPTRTHAILAGREILKTVRVTDSTCSEDFNFRSSIIAYAAAHDSSGAAISAKHKDQLAATDVKWSQGKYDTTIATAAANGQIVIYDLNRPGVELARLHEHSRQVHRVAFNPFQGALLLSGSQDATIRLWDLRALAREESVTTCQSIYKYPGNNEGVRDVRWSPIEGVEFATCTDNGVVQRWDLRKANAPLLKLNAHEKTCYSIDWHPDGKHLASGGADKNIKIWDFSSTDRRMRASWQLRAPKPILNVRWRPAVWRQEEGAPGQWNSTQLATSYDNQDPRIHIWDLRRPSVPSRELDRFETAPTAILWHSKDLLWSVNVAGIFTQTNLSFVDRSANKQRPGTVAFAPDGRLVSFLERRSGRGASMEEMGRNFGQSRKRTGSSGEKLSSSYSATDGSVEETSLLSSSFRARRRKAPSIQSSRYSAGTPPSTGSGGTVVPLDDALQHANLYHPAQAAACGRIRGVFQVDEFVFLARHYHFKLPLGRRVSDTALRVLPQALNRNADLAAYAGQYRLAQSWRIIALALQKELTARAQRNRDRRLLQTSHSVKDEEMDRSNDSGVIETTSRNHPVVALAASGDKQSKRSGPVVLESGSNITTPLARPVPDTAVKLAPSSRTAELDLLELPESAFKKQSPQKPAETTSALSRLRSPIDDSNLDQDHSPKDTSPSNQPERDPNGGSASPNAHRRERSHHLNGQRNEPEHYRPIPRPVLRLEDSVSTPGRDPFIPRFDRHDSNESFQMFSASTDSSHRARSMGGSFESSQPSGGSDLVPQRWHDRRRPSTGHDSWAPSMSNDARTRRLSNNPSKRMNGDSELTTLLPAGDRFLERSILPTRTVNEEDMGVHDPNPRDDVPETDARDKDVYIESDFLPSSEDPPSAPWTATAMLRPLVDYHLEQLTDVQLPAHLLLLLDFHVETNVPAALMTSILLTYHNQLTSLSLHLPAAQLRKVASRRCPEVAEHGTYGITVGGPWCSKCNKASKGERPGFCLRCHEYWASCPVCDGQGPTAVSRDDSSGPVVASKSHQSGDSSWVWCQGCGHGGHLGCLRLWWEDVTASEGGCPTLGCLHDCVAGTRRTAILQRKAENKKASAVKGDAWVVEESQAVEKTRGMIVGNDGGNLVLQDRTNTRPPMGSRGGPLGMGSMGRTGSGGKKVRLLVPQGDSEGRSPDGLGSQGRASASAPSYFSQ
ncbi:MAG: hypothetical protein Q9208_005020 [Pyrenodesmia sp. 3 TL-2023]